MRPIGACSSHGLPSGRRAPARRRSKGAIAEATAHAPASREEMQDVVTLSSANGHRRAVALPYLAVGFSATGRGAAFFPRATRGYRFGSSSCLRSKSTSSLG